MSNFDIVVVGAGHAGIEAANISAQFGLSVCLVTLQGVPIGNAPCNPSIGGVGKGQVVREIDALGGLMGQLTDLAGVQYRTLNESKGYAVRSTRVQIDKQAYERSAELILLKLANLTIVKSRINKLQRDHLGAFHLLLDNEKSLTCKAVVVTAGTFVKGLMHIGEEQSHGGIFEVKSRAPTRSFLDTLQLPLKRFKTGTPPRLLASSIDFSILEVQESDLSADNMHFDNQPNQRFLQQVPCYLTRTTPETMRIIRENRERSPLFNGQIQGVGPRYCPSIEDKAFRYSDRDIHHVFVEPEGLNLNTYYPSGLSTSLPKDVQLRFLRTIPGFENVEIVNYGYAVEYDVIDSSQLSNSLEYFHLPNLYFAGQINGTSGYEEAAAQGFVAGLNSALKLLNRDAVHFSRNDSYIGVLIEDLVGNSRDEPYRLFTARAENRLTLREDNTILRMNQYRKLFGLDQKIDKFQDNFLVEYEILSNLVSSYRYKNSDKRFFQDMNYGPIEPLPKLDELLKRSFLDPVTTLNAELTRFKVKFNHLVVQTAAVSAKYEGYINRTSAESEKFAKLNSKRIIWEDLANSKNISNECKQRIAKIRPATFSELRRIEGIRPATLAYVAGCIL